MQSRRQSEQKQKKLGLPINDFMKELEASNQFPVDEERDKGQALESLAIEFVEKNESGNISAVYTCRNISNKVDGKFGDERIKEVVEVLKTQRRQQSKEGFKDLPSVASTSQASSYVDEAFSFPLSNALAHRLQYLQVPEAPDPGQKLADGLSAYIQPRLKELLNVFLPAGYPLSVTEDYLEYQIYDSLQAFSSSIAGLLSSRAVLQGFGIGDATASPTTAMLLSILQDSIGRLSTIMFAHHCGIALEAECKSYRFAADIFNDSAMILDCLSPAFPGKLKAAALCLSGALRALCGVAAGGSKASLSVHFAKYGNVGELNAKDSSQETVIGLLGMLAGSVVVSHITSSKATWTALLFLICVHLLTNYRAVRSVRLRTLNRQRANIVFSAFHETGKVLTPAEVSKHERIFERSGVLRWAGQEMIGHCEIGGKLIALTKLLHRPPTSSATRSKTDIIGLSGLAKVFQMEQYLLWYEYQSCNAVICLKNGATSREQLKAWSHALLAAHEFSRSHPSGSKPPSSGEILGLLESTLTKINISFTGLLDELKFKGWDLDTPALETNPRYRIGQSFATKTLGGKKNV